MAPRPAVVMSIAHQGLAGWAAGAASHAARRTHTAAMDAARPPHHAIAWPSGHRLIIDSSSTTGVATINRPLQQPGRPPRHRWETSHTLHHDRRGHDRHQQKIGRLPRRPGNTPAFSATMTKALRLQIPRRRRHDHKPAPPAAASRNPARRLPHQQHRDGRGDQPQPARRRATSRFRSSAAPHMQVEQFDGWHGSPEPFVFRLGCVTLATAVGRAVPPLL